MDVDSGDAKLPPPPPRPGARVKKEEEPAASEQSFTRERNVGKGACARPPLPPKGGGCQLRIIPRSFENPVQPPSVRDPPITNLQLGASPDIHWELIRGQQADVHVMPQPHPGQAVRSQAFASARTQIFGPGLAASFDWSAWC